MRQVRLCACTYILKRSLNKKRIRRCDDSYPPGMIVKLSELQYEPEGKESEFTYYVVHSSGAIKSIFRALQTDEYSSLVRHHHFK
jgi:hypothetical protein